MVCILKTTKMKGVGLLFNAKSKDRTATNLPVYTSVHSYYTRIYNRELCAQTWPIKQLFKRWVWVATHIFMSWHFGEITWEIGHFLILKEFWCPDLKGRNRGYYSCDSITATCNRMKNIARSPKSVHGNFEWYWPSLICWELYTEKKGCTGYMSAAMVNFLGSLFNFWINFWP